MKFQCEKCGRSYMADEKVRGRAFKMKCKQCGTLIVVKPELAAAELLRSAAGAGDPPFELGRRPRFDPFAEEAPHANGKHANGMQLPVSGEAEAAFAALDAEMSSGVGFDRRDGEEPVGAIGSIGSIGSEAAAVSTAAGALPAEDEAKLGPVEVEPKPEKKKLPPVSAGTAVLLALLVAAFFLLGGSPSSPGANARTPATAPPPHAAAPAPALEPAPAATPAPAAAATDAPPAVVKVVKKVAKPAEKRSKPKEPVPPRKPEGKPALAGPRTEASQSLAPVSVTPSARADHVEVRRQLPPSDAKVIAATVQKHAKLFQACVADAARNESHIDVNRRRVELMVTVNPSGKTLYPTLDDVQLRDTQLGRCLKDAGTKMQFPPFDGAPERLRVPLTLE